MLITPQRDCFELTCNFCDRIFTLIDKGIAETIIILNRKGYKTLYCCEGHSKEYFPNGGSTIGGAAYISFEHRPPWLPWLAKWDRDNDKVMRFSTSKQKTYKLNELKEWAIGLPVRKG